MHNLFRIKIYEQREERRYPPDALGSPYAEFKDKE